MANITFRPIKVQRSGAKHLICTVRFRGPGAPSSKILGEALNGIELKKRAIVNLPPGTQSALGTRLRIRDASGDIPVISLANTEERSELSGSDEIIAIIDKDTRILYLRVETDDFFGLLQEVTNSANLICLNVVRVRSHQERFGGKSKIDIHCRLGLNDNRGVNDIFNQFRSAFSSRIKAIEELGSEGERLVFVYKNFVNSIGRFLNCMPEVPGILHINVDSVEAAIKKHPALAEKIFVHLRIKFDKLFARAYGYRTTVLPAMKMHIDTQIASLEDERERAVFNLLFLFIQSVENTNAFLPNRNPEVVAFKLNHEVVQKIADHFMITYPTDITYVYSTRTGSHAIGARYGGGVSKGGDRYQPTNKSTYEAVSRSSLIDALRLAWTQELKNLLWGCYVNGLKTVLVAAPVVAENAGLDELIAAIKAIEESIAFPAIKAALFELEIDVDQEIRTTLAEENHDEINELLAKLVQLENLVNLSFGEFDLGNLGDKRPGPDMRMTPAEMDFLAYVAKHLGVLNWEAIYTGKSLEFGGFPHAKFMVTGRGVFENMLIALERLKIDPEQGAVTASIQGFGDVGGSMAYLILNKKRSIKITAISDHTGMLVCPEGFASKKEWEDELERLRQKGLTIDQFSPALLGEGLELRGRDRIDEIVTMPSTIFIPAAIGNVIHKGNVAEFLKAHELTVEGANIAFTPEAARTFDKALGKRILDVMANGGGVSTSTSEILNTQILGVDQFKGRLNRLAQDNEASIIKTTRDNAKYFWDEYERMEGSVSIPDLVHQVVRGMTVMKSIIKVGYEANQEQNGVYSFLFDSVAKSIAETVDPDEILDRLSQSIVREAIATQLARKIAFSHPYDWFNTIPADQRDTFILAEVEKIIAARDETAK